MNSVSTDIIPFTQIERMASAAAKSGLFGVKTMDQALALMLVAQSEGVHPARAMQEYHVIQGRPALKADAMMARYQAAGGKVQWGAYTDTKVEGTFSHPSGGSITIEWTMERAKTAGLTGKDNWKNYPRQMLRSRCISEGIRATHPGIAIGTYTAEEVQDMASDAPTPETVTQAVQNPSQVLATALTEDEIKEHLDAINRSPDVTVLASAFAAAWTHGKGARDGKAQETFKAAYDQKKALLDAGAQS